MNTMTITIQISQEQSDGSVDIQYEFNPPIEQSEDYGDVGKVASVLMEGMFTSIASLSNNNIE